MRILIAIPHFCVQKTDPVRRSELTAPSHRGRILNASLAALHQTFGKRQVYIGIHEQDCNAVIASEIDIVVCTTQGNHALNCVSPDLFTHHSTNAEPEELGYECHAVLADRLGQYDMYCYMEDDLLISDPMFFWKINWFSSAVGNAHLLQPNRFELSNENPMLKAYIDGPLVDAALTERFQAKPTKPTMKANLLGQDVGFERVINAHSGCFFLNEAQMRTLAAQAYFLDRSAEFIGALEGSATLSVMRTFSIYKPAVRNAAFLELRHLDPRYRWKKDVVSGRDQWSFEVDERRQAGT